MLVATYLVEKTINHCSISMQILIRFFKVIVNQVNQVNQDNQDNQLI
jgi:hypothetical protein